MTGDAGNQITIWSIVSLLAGTVISAIVSYLLQRRSFSEAREQRAKDKFEARKTLGLTLFHKMMRITSTLETLKKTLDDAFALAKADQIDGQPWQIVMPVANLPSGVKFTPEEMTFLMLMDMTLFNDMGSCDDIQEGILDMFELYRTKRTAFTDTLSAKMSGMIGTTEFNEAEMLKVAPRMNELNNLITQMIQTTQLESKQAWELFEKLRQRLNKEFTLQLRTERK
jgi:hypothetical protein